MSGSKHTGKQESSTGVINSYENSSEERIDENHSELTVIQIRSVEPEVVDDKTRLSSEPDKTRIAIQTDNQIKNNVDSLNPIDKTVIKPFALSEQTRIQSQAIQPENSIEPEISTTDKKTVSIGSTIKNRFVLLEILGVGGMGKVYKALDLRKQEARDQLPYIAVKLLNDEFKHHPDALIALQREARKSQQLAHPNIVNVHDFDRDEEAVFMTMELLDGQSLEQIIAHDYPSGMPADIAVEIINSLCHALIYAHKHQIIHSDLKPANIFITAGGIPKIFDFGIARACNNSSLKSQAGVSDKTLFDPTALGALTPTYASLAMLEGRAPAESDDLYAICCVFYELLTGKHPYNRVPADKAAEQNLSVKKLIGLNKYQASAIYKGLALKEEDRFNNVEAFLTAFNYKKTNKNIWLISVFVLLLIVTAFFYPQIVNYYQQYQHQKFIDSINTEYVSPSPDSEAYLDTVTAYITPLDIESRNYVLVKIKSTVLDAVKQQIQTVLERDEDKRRYQKAEQILNKAKSYYPDSASLDKLDEYIETHRYKQLNRLNNQFNDLLEIVRYSFFSEPGEADQLNQLINAIKAIDAEHSLLKDERLLLIFQEGINYSLNNRQIKEADRLLYLAESIYSDNLVLKNLKDKIKLQKNKLASLDQVKSSQNNSPINNTSEYSEKLSDQKAQLEALLSKQPITDETDLQMTVLMKTLSERLGKRSQWLSEKKQTLARLYLDHSIAMREQGRLIESRRYLEAARQYSAAVYGLDDENSILTALENIEQVKQKAKQRLAGINGLKTSLISQTKARQLEDAKRTYMTLQRQLGRSDPYISGTAKEMLADAYFHKAQYEYRKKHYSSSRQLIQQGLEIAHQHSGLRSLFKKVNHQISLIEKARLIEQKSGLTKPNKDTKNQSTNGQNLLTNTASVKQGQTITARDNCRSRLAGYGKRKRAQCYDKINGKQKAPVLVVVPPVPDTSSFYAITRYEITQSEFSLFCQQTGACSVKSKSRLPVTGITYKQAEQYAQWLSRVTQQQYSLPSSSQWVNAVKTDKSYKPVDVNCRIQFGSKLLKGRNIMAVNTGESNPWGLLNGIGNVREMVKDGEKISARGGAYTDLLKDCTTDNTVSNISHGDDLTGFRLVRKVNT